jgi:3-methylfumaryl-CoA hydratase
MTVAEEFDEATARAWIGRATTAVDIVTDRLVAAFDGTLAPHLADRAAADAPLALHWCLAPPATPMTDLRPDGHPLDGGLIPPLPFPRRMWAGGKVEPVRALQIGDRVTRDSTIADVALKQGRSGRLCIVTVAHTYSTGAGVALREWQDICYLEEAPPAKAQAARVPDPVRDSDLAWSVEASPALLFRYSALTFNTHRIHYDRPYAMETEGYDGLVVQGPLQASLLLNLAAALGGSAPRHFDYRGVAPLIAGPAFAVAGARGPDGSIECWTRSAAGTVCMKGTARW